MLKELTDYYRVNGISALDFSCSHFSSCSQQYPKKFTTVKEAFVSSEYVNHKLPRLVFVSLDSGSAENDPALKTLESIRIWEEEKEDILSLHKNKHWFRTHELAYTILRNFQPGMRVDEARHYFAHINSAKCCENKPGREQASQILFKNCQRFIPGELEILDPDIIITQGRWGKLALNGAFPELVSPDYIPKTLQEMKLLIINTHPVIWIESYHPRYSGFHTTNKPHYSLYEHVIREFISGQSVFSSTSKVDNRIIPKPEKQVDKNNIRINRLYKKEENSMKNRLYPKVTGYLELIEYPDFPAAEFPTKGDCKGYIYMSMKQLCNIYEARFQKRSPACNAFGGDNGDIPVQPDRQAWVWKQPGHRIKKFVLISAVEKYFQEVGIEWK
jgi:hypothetical protein